MSEKGLELFLEIFSEEIPARLNRFAARKLAQTAASEFGELLGNADITIQSGCAPRRLVLRIENLPDKLPEFSEEIRGPRLSAPQPAIEGFMRKYGIASSEELEKRGEFYFYNKVTKACLIYEACKEITRKIIANFVWPKSMRWGQSKDETWIRPIRSIICVLDGKILEFEYAGVKSGNFSFGHRTLSQNRRFEVLNYQDYLDKLKENGVILGFEERKQIILNYASKISNKYRVELIEDHDLLEEVVGLCEFPNPIMGSIEDKFMSLPPEVLVSAIKSHQKYLMFQEKEESKEHETRKLSKFFLVVADGIYKNDSQSVLKGNQKVLTARLSDAEFFYKNDLKNKLSSKLELLKSRVFHSKIGSVYDKVERMRTIGAKVASYFGIGGEEIDKAILLCKCDLVSEVVFEFPELQGIMGYYYAKAEGFSEDIALAVRDHYKPQGPHDVLPANKIGAIVAIADKLDSLIELFKIDVKPTGSKDPFAQRRAAIGILRILENYGINMPINEFIEDKSLLDFIAERSAG